MDDHADAKVIKIDDHRKGWTTSKANCPSCKYEWQALFLTGLEAKLECPQCHKLEGVAEEVRP